MSMFGSDVYSTRSDPTHIKKNAWLSGKFFSNSMRDFSADIAKSIVNFGKAVKTTLKLSCDGLTTGGGLTKVLTFSQKTPFDSIPIERIYDIYQDSKYANVLDCVIKSKIPEFKYEIYTYKLEKAADVIDFQNFFRELVTGERGPSRVETFRSLPSHQFDTLTLNDVQRRPATRTFGAFDTLDGARYRKKRNSNLFHYPSSERASTSPSNYRSQNGKIDQWKLRVRDIGVQANLDRYSLNEREAIEVNCQRIKVYVNQGSKVADVSCTASPSSNYSDEYDGVAVALVDGNQVSHIHRRKKNTNNDRVRYSSQPQLGRKKLNQSEFFPSRNRREIQTKVMSISSDSSSDDLSFHDYHVTNHTHTGRGHQYYDREQSRGWRPSMVNDFGQKQSYNYRSYNA